MKHYSAASLALALLAAISPASAKVSAQSEVGFAVQGEALVAAGAAETWKQLAAPAKWWSAAHSFSGSSANLTLDPRAGGCFCETLPAGGKVEHMRVIHSAPRKMLRLVGALGPLQSEAVEGTLTVTLKPATAGTVIAWEYVVGGYMRFPVAQIAPAVDRVLGEQFASLARGLGAVPASGSPLP